MQEIIEITSKSTGTKVRLMPVPQDEMFAGIIAAYEMLPHGDINNAEYADLMAKHIVYYSLDYIVGRGYIKVHKDDLEKYREKVLNGAGKLRAVLRRNNKLLMRNIILGENGIFPKGEEDKFSLWAMIMDSCGLGEIGLNYDSIKEAAAKQ